ncbi:TPA: hypothetical protein I8Y75_000911 [Legionella pneumophila]|nr:hypothetical protein [Legionella pneumophila]
MNITRRVRDAIEHGERNVVKDDSLAKCIEFSKQMKEAGLLDPVRETNAEILTGGLEQLKLYQESAVLFKKSL